MSLNIKNEHVHDLARRAAALSGMSQTAVVEVALEQFIESRSTRGEAPSKRDRVRRLRAWLDATITDEDRAAIDETMAEMYDESGLPR